MAAVPSIGRAAGIVPRPVAAPEADATRELYERYARQIYNYCVHQLNSREEAEDAVQTTFMNAFRGLKRGIVPEAEQAWLFKIAENVCLSRRRSSWRRGRVESPNDFEVLQEIVPSQHNRRADELIGLEDALEAMPENQRRAILLREWQGLSYREIAAELELSQAAVETLIFRARRSLAQGLEAPPEPKKKSRLRRTGQSLNLGGLLAGLKSLLSGGAAVKAVAVAVAAGTATVAATETSGGARRHPAVRPRAVVTAQSKAAFRPQTSFFAAGPTAAHARAKVHAAGASGQGKTPAPSGDSPSTPPTPSAPSTPTAPSAPSGPAAPAGGGDPQATPAPSGDSPVVPVTPTKNVPNSDPPKPNAPKAGPPTADTPRGEPANGDNPGNGGGNGNARGTGPKSDPPKVEPPRPQANEGPGNGNADGGNGSGENGNGNDKKPEPAPAAAPAAPAPAASGSVTNGGSANGSKGKGK